MKYVIALFIAGCMMFLAFWTADFSFHSVEHGSKYVYIPIIRVSIKAGELWNISWIIVFLSCLLAIIASYKMKK